MDNSRFTPAQMAEIAAAALEARFGKMPSAF
jgi:hypothetical protein